MSNLYLQNFLSSAVSGGPGVIQIYLPPGAGSKKITGILTSEIWVNAQTRFGPIIPDVSLLADIAAFAGSASLPSWVGCSSQSWRGTDPISFSADFFLVNYSSKIRPSHEESLEALMKMCTLNATGGATVSIHGGYSIDPTADNNKFLNSAISAISMKDANMEDRAKEWNEGLLTDFSRFAQVEGTITVRVGNNFELGNLLVTQVSASPSNVEVASSDGSNAKPLYYRVSCSFMTCRAGLSGDVDGMFGG